MLNLPFYIDLWMGGMGILSFFTINEKSFLNPDGAAQASETFGVICPRSCMSHVHSRMSYQLVQHFYQMWQVVMYSFLFFFKL